MASHYLLEQGEIGPRVVLTGPWSPAVGDYIRREGIGELYLNPERGWRGHDIEFVRELPALRGFGILDFTIKDVSPVHALHELRYLEVSTYCKTPIDFTAFPGLEQAAFYWRPGSESLFERTSLRELFLHRYAGKSSEPFARLGALESLTVATSALEEVRSLGRLGHLRMLALHNLKKLRSLAGLESLRALETLEINECSAVESIEPLAALTALRRLLLIDDGKIASLTPIRAATRLEDLLFYGSTNIVDGDLSFLLSLPHLRTLSYQNRKHYSHRRESFAASA